MTSRVFNRGYVNCPSVYGSCRALFSLLEGHQQKSLIREETAPCQNRLARLVRVGPLSVRTAILLVDGVTLAGGSGGTRETVARRREQDGDRVQTDPLPDRLF